MDWTHKRLVNRVVERRRRFYQLKIGSDFVLIWENLFLSDLFDLFLESSALAVNSLLLQRSQVEFMLLFERL